MQTFYENGQNIKNRFRKLRAIFGQHGPSIESEKRWIVIVFKKEVYQVTRITW